MADIFTIRPGSCCFSCLSSTDEKNLQMYCIQKDSIKTILQTEHLTLCYICKRVAENAEKFIHNVEITQSLFKNIQNMTECELGSMKSLMKPTLQLSVTLLAPGDVLEMTGKNPEDDDNIKIEYDSGSLVGGNKIECVKQEPDERMLEDNFEYFLNSLENEYAMKEEENNLLKLPKEELKINITRVKQRRKHRKREIVDKMKNKGNLLDTRESLLLGNMDTKIETLILSSEQCLAERAGKRLDKLYQGSEYKCEDCIKGFSYKPSFDKHMLKHSKISGDYECDVCKLRVASEEKLYIHKRYHTMRYRCMQCNLTRVCRNSISEHISTEHGLGAQFRCFKCGKCYKRQSSLRKHNYYAHKEKIECSFCNKHYATKESLKAHLRRRHPTEVSASRPVRKHACEECEMAFENPSQLKTHSAKHSHARNYYCVECDKSFKTNTSLQQHLKTVLVHATQEDLRFPCPKCEKRFTTKSHADRHLNDVHMKTARFYCDQCGKEYRCKYKLAGHLRAHGGYEKPRKFFCSVCFKGFHAKRVLDVHLRIHTGERPFLCPQCPAQFNQYGSLYNHKRLVHKLVGKHTDKQTHADID